MRNDIEFRRRAVKSAQQASVWLVPYAGFDLGRVFSHRRYGVVGGSLGGATIGLRMQRENLDIELSYSKLIGAPRELADVRRKSGVLSARLTMMF